MPESLSWGTVIRDQASGNLRETDFGQPLNDYFPRHDRDTLTPQSPRSEEVILPRAF
jgi:hypothetical protein